MRVVFTAMTLLSLVASAMAAEDGPDRWIGKARSTILSHHLLSPSDLRCTALLYDDVSTPTMASITAVEKHGGRCKGDQQTSSRMFTMNIDKATGQASWDRDTGDFVMKPIPERGHR